MSLLESARPFSSEQLGILEDSLNSSLKWWAATNPAIRESRRGHRFIRDMAAAHAMSKVALARGRLLDFKFATTLGHDMDRLYLELQNHSPKERAGMAAGQLAVAKVLTKWYSLKQQDFARLNEPQNMGDFVNMQVEGLQEAVCTTPKTLGIAAFTALDVYLEEMSAAEKAVSADGPKALDRYMEFPKYPLRA